LVCGSLSLTLTLSRWERGQLLVAHLKFESLRAAYSAIFIMRGERFPLAQRERAGVRENVQFFYRF
jgi:hypothetical protein